MSRRQGLSEQISQIALCDTHEHIHLQPLAPEEEGMWGLLAGAYVYLTFHLAGAPLEAFAQRPGTVEAEFAAFAPYLEAVQTTSYFHQIWSALQLAFGVKELELDADLYTSLNKQIRAAQADPAWGKRLLQQTAGIEKALLDTYWDVTNLEMDRDLFDPVLRVNAFVMCPYEGMSDHNETSLWDYQDLLGVTVRSFADFLELFEAMLERHSRAGAKAIKLALAYDRDLEFLPVERQEAERIWNAGPEVATPRQLTALQDFLNFYAVEQAASRHLPVQIHTGILEGLRNYRPPQVAPSLLVPLIAAHPQAQFDLFHAGFPYARELATMAMNFPNIWADLCWVPLISPTAAVQILDEWIDMIPGNKLLWGGDCANPLTALGAALLGRQVIAETLSRKREAGALREAQALRLAELILHDNATELFYGQ